MAPGLVSRAVISAADQTGINERARCVMNENTIRPASAQRFEASEHRGLACCAAWHRAQQALGERSRSPVIEFGVLAANNDHGCIDLRMQGQSAQ